MTSVTSSHYDHIPVRAEQRSSDANSGQSQSDVGHQRNQSGFSDVLSSLRQNLTSMRGEQGADIAGAKSFGEGGFFQSLPNADHTSSGYESPQPRSAGPGTPDAVQRAGPSHGDLLAENHNNRGQVDINQFRGLDRGSDHGSDDRDGVSPPKIGSPVNGTLTAQPSQPVVPPDLQSIDRAQTISLPASAAAPSAPQGLAPSLYPVFDTGEEGILRNSTFTAPIVYKSPVTPQEKSNGLLLLVRAADDGIKLIAEKRLLADRESNALVSELTSLLALYGLGNYTLSLRDSAGGNFQTIHNHIRQN